MDIKQAVATVINKYDIMDLLSIGCPIDEYEPEIDMITNEIYKLTIKDLGNFSLVCVIRDTFAKMFSCCISEEYSEEIAQEIIDMI